MANFWRLKLMTWMMLLLLTTTKWPNLTLINQNELWSSCSFMSHFCLSYNRVAFFLLELANSTLKSILPKSNMYQFSNFNGWIYRIDNSWKFLIFGHENFFWTPKKGSLWWERVKPLYYSLVISYLRTENVCNCWQINLVSSYVHRVEKIVMGTAI